MNASDELASLRAERDAALAREAALAEVLTAINASAADVTPVFDLMLAKAMHQCGAAFGVLLDLEGPRTQLRATRAVPAAYLDHLMAQPPEPSARGDLATALQQRRVLQNLDAMTSEAYRQDDPNVLAMADLGGARTVLFVPLVKGAASIGAFLLYRQEVRAFTAQQIGLAESFAALAVTAIENARLLAEQQAALARQTATAEILATINANPGDLAPVFDIILEKAHILCNAVAGTLHGYDGERFRALTTRGGSPEWAAALREPREPGPNDRKLVDGARFVHIADLPALEDSPQDDASLRLTKRNPGWRTLFVLPLRKDGRLLGYISSARLEQRPFSDQEIALLETFAAQAVIAMENARLLTEQREALARQTATADVLQVINAHPGNLTPVFDAILDKAHALCGAAVGALFLADGEQARAVATHGYPAEIDAMLRTARRVSGRASNLTAGARTHQTEDIRFGASSGPLDAAVSAFGVRTSLLVALREEDRLLGWMTANRLEKRPFTAAEIALLESFAAQAVIAIRTAETIHALEARTAELASRNSDFAVQVAHQSAMIDVLKAMSSTAGDIHPVFDTILQRSLSLCEATTGALFEYDGERVHFRHLLGHGAANVENYAKLYPLPLSREWHFHQAMLDGELQYRRDLAFGEDRPAALRALGIRSQVSAPLMRNGAAVGCLVVTSPQADAFSAKHLSLLSTFAEQAAIATASVATFRALQDRTAELTRSVAELQALQDVLGAVNASLDLETVLSTIIARAVGLAQADEGTIYEFEDASETFLPRAAAGMSADRIARLAALRIRMGETYVGQSAELREPILIDDAHTQFDTVAAPDVLAGIRAMLAVPLLRSDGVVGCMVIRRRREGGFAPEVVKLMQTFAAQSVLAIANARLFDQVQARTRELSQSLDDLHRTQDRLVQTEKLASLGQLTAGIAHEIKNPLNFVNNFAALSTELIDELREVLAPEPLGAGARADADELTATIKGNLEKVVSHGKRADSIVKNMLQHSRSGTSERRVVDLNATVEEALNLAYHGKRAETPGFNITLETALDPQAGAVEMFPQEFTRVILNICGNGFYAAHQRLIEDSEPNFAPTLWLRTRGTAETVEIRIRDNGRGMPDTVKARIFEPFFTTKPAGEGTGLGLSLSHDIIVKQHGGTLTVQSEPDRFTEFTITIPRRLPDGAQA